MVTVNVGGASFLSGLSGRIAVTKGFLQLAKNREIKKKEQRRKNREKRGVGLWCGFWGIFTTCIMSFSPHFSCSQENSTMVLYKKPEK